MITAVSEKRSVFFWVLTLSFLVFFAQTKDFKLLIDGLTYAALAKNILKTGDWRVLHYSLDQYKDFFQHPPFAIWVQALIYKAFGFSEPISRIFPSLCAVGSVAGVFCYSYLRKGLSTAFFSSLILITSTRYVKWGSNFYLDGIFAFFCFSGFIFWYLRNQETRFSKWFPLISGLFFSAATLTKGVLVLGPIGVVLFSSLFEMNKKTLRDLSFLLLSFIIPLAYWYFFFGGDYYFHQYLTYSVMGRVAGFSFSLSPWNNLFFRWLPWVACFAISLRKWDRENLWFFFAALSFPLGFSLNGAFLEHYLTPFYPFAAVVAGTEVARWVPELSTIWVRNFKILVIGVAVFLATISPNVNEMKETPVHQWIQVLRQLPSESKSKIQVISFTEKSADIWYGLANILGKTDWQAIGNFSLSLPPRPNMVLITTVDQKPDPAWQIANCLVVNGFRFYHSPDLNLCTQ